MSSQPKPILKGNVRILRPTEYEQLRSGAALYNPANQIKLDALLVMGVRYQEGVRIQDHPDWFDGRFVYLPREAQLKAEQLQKERWIRIGAKGVGVLVHFWGVRELPRAWSTWRENLVRWARAGQLDPIGLSPKTTRKTYESWLAKCYPERILEVAMRQGHTIMTQARFYLNLPFTQEDVDAMKPWVEGVF